MALHYDTSKIIDTATLYNIPCNNEPPKFPEGSDEDKEGDNQYHITQSLIWVTMAIGMSSITTANADKFFMRVAMYEQAFGAWMQKGSEPYPFTVADIHRRIGLSTNASALTDAQFNKRLIERLKEEACAQVNRYRAERTAAEVNV